MMKQKISGTEEIAIKYHGKVKFVNFECNNCHKKFARKESYFKKQLKRRPSACCFCSAACRTGYFSKRKFIEKAYQGAIPEKHTEKEGFLKNLLGNLFGS